MRLEIIFSLSLLLLGSFAVHAETTFTPRELPSFRQPFLIELLGQERGHWVFKQLGGQKLEHPGPVAVSAAIDPATVQTVILRLDNPEFPGSAQHAKVYPVAPVAPEKFELRTGGFAADLTLTADGGNCGGSLTAIRLGNAAQADGILNGIYLSDGARAVPLQLVGHNQGCKLESDRVGNLFIGDEPIVLHVVRPDSKPAEATYTVTDYFRKREINSGKISLAAADTPLTVPVPQFGSFTVQLTLPQQTLSLRVTRIPEPQVLSPERSFTGINIYQQQMHYYSYQLPMFANAGVRWVRPWLAWENTWKTQAPRPGVFDTAQLDILLRQLTKHNQKYVYLLYDFPAALGVKDAPLNQTQMDSWCQYVKQIVAHCPQVDDWEIWNEPDYPHYSDILNAAEYRRFVIQTAQAIRSVRPEVKIHTLSHAGQLNWLETLSQDTTTAQATDIVTLHSYAPGNQFMENELPRQHILDRGGFLGKPQQFNEIGASAYDESPEYIIAHPGTTERIQAETLPVNWAQALHFGGPQGKVYWFCSLDPRDSSNPAQWTDDSGFGLLYLGLQPKTAFAALAGMAKILDGHECLGRVELPDSPVRYVAFADDRAVLWSDDRKGTITAAALGCPDNEELTIFDLFGNQIDRAKAQNVMIDLSDGPRFIVGCKQLGELARADRERWLQQRSVTAAAERQVGFPAPIKLKAAERKSFTFTIPQNCQVTWQLSPKFPGEIKIAQTGTVVSGEVTAAATDGLGLVDFDIRLADPGLPAVHRQLMVSSGRIDYIPNGSFSSEALSEYKLISGVSYNHADGATAPGCMQYRGPFPGNRLHLASQAQLIPDKTLYFKVALKGKLAADAKVSFNAAMFVNGKWVGTWMAASWHDNATANSPMQEFTAAIPEHLEQWTVVEAKLPGRFLPKDKNSMIFFIDVKNGGADNFLLIDDLELCQKDNDTDFAATPWNNWRIERKQGLTAGNDAITLQGPLSVRLNTAIVPPVRKFRVRLSSQLSETAQVKIALACFNGQNYLEDRILTATQGQSITRLPRQSNGTVELSGDLPPLPDNCNRCLLFVDGKGSAETDRCDIFTVELSQ